MAAHPDLQSEQAYVDHAYECLEEARRRRHFATKGRRLLDIEDENFGDPQAESEELVGKAALLAALERGRTGRLGDIVATIQSEQDQIIRDELGGIIVVQGGPGTGKT